MGGGCPPQGLGIALKTGAEQGPLILPCGGSDLTSTPRILRFPATPIK